MYVIERRGETGTEYLTLAGEWSKGDCDSLAFFHVSEALEHAKQTGGTHVRNTRVGNLVAVWPGKTGIRRAEV